jgi:hypothetical protein
MRWKANEGREWRKAFAVFPTKIGGSWIWFEWYDKTGWYYKPEVQDLVFSRRYPSQLK